jgi:hypothetical protein
MEVLPVQFDAEFDFLQSGITTTLYDALTPLPWPYFVFHFGTEPTTFGANYSTSPLLLVLVSLLVVAVVAVVPVQQKLKS